MKAGLLCRQVAALAGQHGVAENELEMMIDEVAAAVERWLEFAGVVGVVGVRGVVGARISRRLVGVRFGCNG